MSRQGAVPATRTPATPPANPLVKVLCTRCQGSVQPRMAFAVDEPKKGSYRVWIRRTTPVRGLFDTENQEDKHLVETSVSQVVVGDMRTSGSYEGACDRHGQVVVYGRDLAAAIDRAMQCGHSVKILSAHPNPPRH